MLNSHLNFQKALKEVVYAYQKTPFYKDHLEENSISLRDILTFRDLNNIPPTSKIHYRKNFPMKVLSDGYTLKDERLYQTTSSGTAGERLITLEVGMFYLKRAMDTLSVNPKVAQAFSLQPRKHIRYAAPNCSDVECANPNSTMADRLLGDGTLVLSVYHDLLTTTERMLAENLTEIDAYQPNMYYIDSTHLAFLCRYMQKVGYTPPKAPVLASYTATTQISKRQVREAFGHDTPFAEFVSMSELGWIALECPKGSLHLNNTSYYVELIRGNTPAKPGELGELYVTTLDNGCTPKVRYKTGDIYKYVENKCSCGHDFPVVELHGRLQDFIFKDNEILLTPKDVDNIIHNAPWMDLYKFVQEDKNRFDLSFIPNSHFQPGMEEEIYSSLRKRLGEDADLTINKTNYIPTERSGKFLSCISTTGREQIKNGFQL